MYRHVPLYREFLGPLEGNVERLDPRVAHLLFRDRECRDIDVIVRLNDRIEQVERDQL